MPISARWWASERKRTIGKVLVAALALILLVFVGRNRRSLRKGLSYLRQRSAWDPDDARSVDPDGAFGICHDLVRFTNTARQNVIVRCLRDLKLKPILVPVPNEPVSNVLALLHDSGPYTLFMAHYDKSRETETYQAASDNTAAVCVLLAAARDLAGRPGGLPVAFLFTSGEERGLKGASSFMSWADAEGLAIGEVINFDMIGRGKLASRPSALPGFYFWLPGLGEMVFDGRRIRQGQAYPLPDPNLISHLKAVLGDELVIYQSFTARSDSNVFQAAGIPTVSLSSDDMYYLDLVWERDADRLELLDERNLDLARRLVVEYARR